MRTARVTTMRTTRATTGTNKQKQANKQKESMRMAGMCTNPVGAAAAAAAAGVTPRTNKGQHK
jgi:hypothetical protein